jgi:hypothetical protein
VVFLPLRNIKNPTEGKQNIEQEKDRQEKKNSKQEESKLDESEQGK